MNTKSIGILTVLATLLAGFAATAFLWPGFLRAPQNPDEKMHVEVKDDGKKKTEEIKKDGEKPPEKKPSVFKKDPPDIDDILIVTRELTKKEPKLTDLNNWPDQTFINITALQTLVAVKTGDKKHLDEAKITADCCRTVGAKAHAYYVLAVGQARMGDIKQATATFDEAAAMYSAVIMRATFEAHFAAASSDRSFFARAHKTAREAPAGTGPEITKIQARHAVKTKDKSILPNARKAVAEHAGIYQQKSLAYIAQAEAELGDKDAAMKLFAEASKVRGVWDVIRIMADTAVVTGDDRFLIEAEKLTPKLDTPDVVGIGYRSLAMGHARRALTTGDAKRFAQAIEFAKKAEGHESHAGLDIVKALVESAVLTKAPARLAEAGKTMAEFDEVLDGWSRSSAMADIAAAEIRLAALKNDPALREKGIKIARKLHGEVRPVAIVASALAETGHFADYEKLSDRPSPYIYLGLAEGLMRRNGWWSADELACNSPGSQWLHN